MKGLFSFRPSCRIIVAVCALFAFAYHSSAQFTGPTNTTIPIVTVVATDPVASVSGDTGTFTVYRAGSTSNALNVFYLIGGTASNGVDYATLPNIVSIPAGISSVQIMVKPIVDPLPDPTETVILHLAPAPFMTPINYMIGAPDTAVVSIVGDASNSPPQVTLVSPMNGNVFHAPADIALLANATDPDGFPTITKVEFFEGANSLGVASNYPSASVVGPFHLLWTNVPPGNYTLSAVATDDHGATGTSAPVKITVTLPVTNAPVVTIIATDPIAVEGTNFVYATPPNVFSNFCSGANTATFLVRRTGDTNASLTVHYLIGGTASNGVDYVSIPGLVTIPAGQRFALITIVPIEDIDPSTRPFDTVILSLMVPPTSLNGPTYSIGWPAKAEAIILEDHILPGPPSGVLSDNSFHFCLPATNGQSFCIQLSTNLVDWQPVCTNTVVKGSIQFADPEATNSVNRYYRAVPASGPPLY
ncbi:MAG: Na-Ca exchanger/integrin-beta4 [Pedosphaera sp.]|nr:Na-Ca exchanger/integrin-beta4 [Pedosphaera sp.]